MGKFLEAAARLFKNKFVCRNCKSTVRAPNLKIISGKVRCRNCSSHALRPVRKK
jgi:hypothetical protein